MAEPKTAEPVAAARAEPGFPPGVAYVDGRFCAMSEAKISVLDWGFLRSDATYDVVHVWQGRFFRLDKHLDRFLRSVEKLRMTLPMDRGGLQSILIECVRRAGLRDAYVEMICTRGHAPDYSRDPRRAVNAFLAFAIPFSSIADQEQRERGLHIAVSHIPRIPPESVDPTVKNYHWLDLVSGLFDAYDRGAENVVLTDLSGDVTEGAGFNVFAVAGGRAFTPERGVLEGVTRIAPARRRGGLHHIDRGRDHAGDADRRRGRGRRQAGPGHPAPDGPVLGQARRPGLDHRGRLRRALSRARAGVRPAGQKNSSIPFLSGSTGGNSAIDNWPIRPTKPASRGPVGPAMPPLAWVMTKSRAQNAATTRVGAVGARGCDCARPAHSRYAVVPGAGSTATTTR
jgi:branched-chain amino acid aminotransferase